MDLIFQTRKSHRYEPVDPANPVTFDSTEKQYILPNDGQATDAEMRHFFDANGHTIREDSLLVRDGISGEIIHASSAFQCMRCYLFCSLKYRAKRVAAPGPVVPLSTTPAEASAIQPVTLGYCRRCWWKIECWKWLLKSALRAGVALLRAMLRPISDEKESPTANPAPVPAAPEPLPTQAHGNGISRVLTRTMLLALSFIMMAGASPSYAPFPQEVSMKSESEPSISPRQVERLLEEAARLGLDQKRVHRLGWAISAALKLQLQQGVIEPSRYQALQTLVERRLQTVDDHLLAFPPSPTEFATVPNPICFYRTLFTNAPVPFEPLFLRRGYQHFADTGHGKSTGHLHTAMQWAAMNMPCIVFVARPDQFFFTLARLFPDRCLLLKCGKDSFYNAFHAITGRPRDFLSTKLQHWQAVYQRWDSAAIVSRIVHDFEAEQKLTGQVAPTIRYFLDKIESLKLPRDLFNPMLKASAYNVFTQMDNGPLGVTMSCQRGLALDQVLDQRLILVIETSLLNDTDTHFLISCILADLRKAKELRPDLPDVLVVIDEAGAIISRRWDSGNRASPLASEVVLLRGSGICLAIGYHSISLVNPLVRANAAITVIGGLGSGDDIYAAAQTAALTPDQRAALSHLRPGVAILKMAGAEHTDPFPVTWDPIPFSPPITESEREAINQPVLKRLPPILPGDYRATATAIPSAPRMADTADWRILNDVLARPYLTVTERASTLELTPGQPVHFRELKRRLSNLESQGCCAFLSARMSRKGANSEYWLLTRKGHDAIGSATRPHRGGTDYKHLWAQEFVRHILSKRGISADIEVKGAVQVDVGFTDPATGRRVAVEICLNTQAHEARKSVEILKEWDRLLVLSLTTDDRKKLEQRFLADLFTPAQPADPRVSLCLPYHLAHAPALADVYDSPPLVFDEKTVASQTTTKRRPV